MALRHASAFALRTWPLGEADLIVEMFSLERGRIRVVARSARRPKSRFGSALQPFTRSHVVYFQREKDDLGRLSSAEIERSYFECLATLETAPLAAYMAELIIGFTPEHDPAPTLFRLTSAVLDSLESGADPELMARYFEIWILRISGLLPDLSHCANCGRDLARDAWVAEAVDGFVCGRECGGGGSVTRLAPPARTLLAVVLAHSPRELAGGEVSRGAVRALEGATGVFIRAQLDRTPRSLRVLRRLRGGVR
ncbi:MAG: DNA repair protein RecO [Acidobacteria bacterium]|nr:DNA repair protein RecO [Acidobacteriota bacterium]